MTAAQQHIEVLIDHCKSGNQRAQMEVYNRYYKAMYNTSFRIVKDHFKAEDIMQESFLTAFTKLSSLKNNVTFGAWLKRIVINNSIYYYHKNQKNNDVPLDAMIYKIEDDPTLTEDYDYTNIQVSQILQGMESLKTNYRLVLTLFLIEGYDQKEICEIMNLSSANCRTMISRAKNSLRHKLMPLKGIKY